MIFDNKECRDSIRIRFTRDSVNMGDDCMAPHEKEILFEPSDTLYDLLNTARSYVPSMYDYEWEVMCGAVVLGRLISDSAAVYKYVLDQPNMKVSALAEYEIFCRQSTKKEPLSYFEQIEVLYHGQYFNLTAFREYGDIRTILEKGVTKITTCDKEFALKYDFHHRELQWYDKLLKICEFEGLRIVRIPNVPGVNTEYIEIPKIKVIEELEKQA